MEINAELQKANLSYLMQDSQKCVDYLLQEASKTNAKDYSFELVEGKTLTVSVNGIQLSSRHDRLLFASQRCKSVSVNATEVHIYGFGLGDDISYLCDKISKSSKIYIHLLNTEIFWNLLGLIELPCQDRGGIYYLVEDENLIDPKGVFSIPDIVLADKKHSRIASIIDSILELPLAQRNFRKCYDQMKKRFDQIRSYLSSDLDVRDLFNSCQGKKIAVISAGPSLELTCDKLSSFKSQGGIMIAVDTAGKCLSQNGIRVDYLVSVDANIRPERLGLDAFSDAPLIYAPSSHESLLKAFEGRRYVAYPNSELYHKLAEEIPHSFLYSSGSVTHCAVDLAVRMGASEVYLYGSDFSFPGGKTHAGYANYQESIRSCLIPKDLEKIYINDVKGNSVETSRPFRAYLYDLERYIACCSKSVRFVNMSPVGARIKGAEDYRE